MYNVLLSGANLVKRGKSDNTLCPLCREKQTLEHVLSICKVALGHGRFMWHHNMMLKELMVVMDVSRMRANKGAYPSADLVHFLKAGLTAQESGYYSTRLPSFLENALD